MNTVDGNFFRKRNYKTINIIYALNLSMSAFERFFSKFKLLTSGFRGKSSKELKWEALIKVGLRTVSVRAV